MDNSSFWDELSGTPLAKSIGLKDRSPRSLTQFDLAYFAMYPYLGNHIPFANLRGRRVLEVGLGFGSLATRLARWETRYTGLDIAAGPVAVVNQRLGREAAVRGSILEAPFEDASFDHVIALGCFHHTGDLPRAIAETRRILRPGGGMTISVYNANSYRRLAFWRAAEAKRAAYDRNSAGAAAPITEFVSAAGLAALLTEWTDVRISKENIGAELFLRLIPRRLLLATAGKLVGLDLYCTAARPGKGYLGAGELGRKHVR